ncbi:hypothetical protein NKH59_32820, partial [Mesorhizobium sp. M0998]
EKRRHVELALEQARYEAAHARRQYDAVDQLSPAAAARFILDGAACHAKRQRNVTGARPVSGKPEHLS